MKTLLFVVGLVLINSTALAGCFTHTTFECVEQWDRDIQEHSNKMEALQRELDIQAKLNEQEQQIQQLKRDQEDQYWQQYHSGTRR